MKDKTFLAAIAMMCITVMETVNLVVLKCDGAILAGAVGAIAGLGGFILGKLKESK
jgi:hypothetical protein